MKLLGFFIRTAVNHLRRGGQRNLVAMLCIAFGVMSLVAMTLLSQSIMRTMVVDPRYMIGADLSLAPRNEEYIQPEDTAGLDKLQAEGVIEQYTLAAHYSSLALRLPETGELSFINIGLGIDPSVYPLIGQITVGVPGGTGLPTLLQSPGDVILTSDLAAENHLTVGDRILLSNLESGSSIEVRLRGIVTDTPNHQGGRMYFSRETAALLSADQPYLNLAIATSANPQQAEEQLEQAGWDTYTAVVLAKGDQDAQDLIDICLRGSGILGLLVGGIGIANTMQVLLRRRREEVAVWKTLGYQEWHLQVLFASEAGLLGLAGSLLGALAGIAISIKLVDLFTKTSNLLITWSFSLTTVVSSILVGVFSTIIFAMIAIVAAGQVNPQALLRDEALNAARMPWYKTVGLMLLLAVPFTALTSVAMGSILSGIGVLLFALAGLVLLGGLLGALAWIVTRLLPFKSFPLMQMAKNSLRRRGVSLIFAMIALFTGVVAMGMGFVITESAQREIEVRNLSKYMQYNLAIIAPLSQNDSVQQTIDTLPIEAAATGYKMKVQAIQVEDYEDVASIEPVIVSRSEPHDYEIQGAAWGSAPQGVYVYQYNAIPVGSQVTVTFPDSSLRTFEVVGTYTPNFMGSPTRETGLLVSDDLMQQLSPDTVQHFLLVPLGQLKDLNRQLSSSLPNLTVVNLLAYASRYTQMYHNLFVLAVAMAGLALLAGVLLVANSVSLAMLDRRYEIGVLKSMGYARRHVLFTLVVEYSLVALIASAAGLGAVQLFLWILGLANPLAAGLIVLRPVSAALILLTGTGLTLLAALGVAWRPTQVSPILILNDRT